MTQLEIKMGAELNGPLQFEMLLAEISTFFINLPTDRIDSEIEAAQRRVCEFLDLDRSSLFQISEREPETLLLTHVYQPPGSKIPPERMSVNEFFPWALQKVLSGEIITISKMTDLPVEAGRDRESFDLYGTKSLVVVPLMVGGRNIFGLLTFAVMREERDWQQTLVQKFKLVAQIFANALGRKRVEINLRESNAKLNIVTDAAGAGLWIVELDTGNVWVTPKTRELFHLAPDEELNYESFFKMIHPDDIEQVRQAMQQAIKSGEEFWNDFRIILPNGSIRWIVVRGKHNLISTGRSARLMGVLTDITKRKQMEEHLKEQLLEIENLKQRLEQENLYLQEEVKHLTDHVEIVGQSLVMKRILNLAEQVAPTDSTVLILGETGTGKKLLARAVHSMSSRKDQTMVTVNCASLPPALIESELFGREKGAYTGALTRMAGRFELADKSTIFLDEIGELPLDIQSKLLRVLEYGRFEHLGSTKPLQVNVRVISATNRDLAQDVKEGKFRKDLFYRLNVFPILIPPLRERTEDIPLMVWAFVREFQKKMGKEIESIPRKTMEALQSYSWPGNVRELRNVIEHAMILNKDRSLVVSTSGIASLEAQTASRLYDVERGHIMSVLKRTGWRVAGKGGAAEVLGLKRTTLYSKMKKLGIDRPLSK